MQSRLSERVPIDSLKADIIFPLKVATKGQKMLAIIMTLRWMRLINFQQILVLMILNYDTFIPWLHGTDNLLNSK